MAKPSWLKISPTAYRNTSGYNVQSLILVSADENQTMLSTRTGQATFTTNNGKTATLTVTQQKAEPWFYVARWRNNQWQEITDGQRLDFSTSGSEDIMVRTNIYPFRWRFSYINDYEFTSDYWPTSSHWHYLYTPEFSWAYDTYYYDLDMYISHLQESKEGCIKLYDEDAKNASWAKECSYYWFLDLARLKNSMQGKSTMFEITFATKETGSFEYNNNFKITYPGS